MLGIVFFFSGVFVVIFFLALWVTGNLAYGLLLVAILCWIFAFFIFTVLQTQIKKDCVEIKEKM
ncbi:MAG: hypothetical protein CMM56_01865 [Rhodospirillaceae bacterium]|nr:hypothetical protein [Rhodospirillaceae bacterium]